MLKGFVGLAFLILLGVGAVYVVKALFDWEATVLWNPLVIILPAAVFYVIDK